METSCLSKCSNFKEKDFPVQDSLAELINVACTAHCETESNMGCYICTKSQKTVKRLLHCWLIKRWGKHQRKGQMLVPVVDIQNLVAYLFSDIYHIAFSFVVNMY